MCEQQRRPGEAEQHDRFKQPSGCIELAARDGVER
jgi:hypothetical protein